MLRTHDAINSLFVRCSEVQIEKKHVPPDFLFRFGFWAILRELGFSLLGLGVFGLIGMHQGLINNETKMKREPKKLNGKPC